MLRKTIAHTVNDAIFVGCVAKGVKTSFLRLHQLHDLGSTSTLVTLLRPWTKRFTMIISAWGFEQTANLRW